MRTILDEILIKEESDFSNQKLLLTPWVYVQNEFYHEFGNNSSEVVKSSEDAKKLQRALNELLGLQLSVDGDLGSVNSSTNSRNAIAAFQELAGLPPTKKVSQSTLDKLGRVLSLNRTIVDVNRFYVFNNFDIGKNEIKKEHLSALCEFKKNAFRMFVEKKVDTIFVIGHTDKSGGEKNNKKLSEHRASEMCRHLLTAWTCDDRFYIDLKTLFVRFIGLGESHPIPAAPNSSNRRVEFVLLKMNR